MNQLKYILNVNVLRRILSKVAIESRSWCRNEIYAKRRLARIYSQKSKLIQIIKGKYDSTNLRVIDRFLISNKQTDRNNLLLRSKMRSSFIERRLSLGNVLKPDRRRSASNRIISLSNNEYARSYSRSTDRSEASIKIKDGDNNKLQEKESRSYAQMINDYSNAMFTGKCKFNTGVYIPVRRSPFGTLTVVSSKGKPIDHSSAQNYPAIMQRASASVHASSSSSLRQSVRFKSCKSNNHDHREFGVIHTIGSLDAMGIKEGRSYAKMIADYSDAIYRKNNGVSNTSVETAGVSTSPSRQVFHDDRAQTNCTAQNISTDSNHTIQGTTVKQIDWYKRVENVLQDLRNVKSAKSSKDQLTDNTTRQPADIPVQKDIHNVQRLNNFTELPDGANISQQHSLKIHDDSKLGIAQFPSGGGNPGYPGNPGLPGQPGHPDHPQNPTNSANSGVTMGPSNATPQNPRSTQVTAQIPQVELRLDPSATESVVSVNTLPSRIADPLNPDAKDLSVVVQHKGNRLKQETPHWVPGQSYQHVSSSAQRATHQTDFSSMHITISEESSPIKHVELSVNGKPISEVKMITARTDKLDVVSSLDKIEIRVPFARRNTKVNENPVTVSKHPESVLNLQINTNFDGPRAEHKTPVSPQLKESPRSAPTHPPRIPQGNKSLSMSDAKMEILDKSNETKGTVASNCFTGNNVSGADRTINVSDEIIVKDPGFSDIPYNKTSSQHFDKTNTKSSSVPYVNNMKVHEKTEISRNSNKSEITSQVLQKPSSSVSTTFSNSRINSTMPRNVSSRADVNSKDVPPTNVESKRKETKSTSNVTETPISSKTSHVHPDNLLKNEPTDKREPSKMIPWWCGDESYEKLKKQNSSGNTKSSYQLADIESKTQPAENNHEQLITQERSLELNKSEKSNVISFSAKRDTSDKSTKVPPEHIKEIQKEKPTEKSSETQAITDKPKTSDNDYHESKIDEQVPNKIFKTKTHKIKKLPDQEIKNKSKITPPVSQQDTKIISEPTHIIKPDQKTIETKIIEKQIQTVETSKPDKIANAGSSVMRQPATNISDQHAKLLNLKHSQPNVKVQQSNESKISKMKSGKPQEIMKLKASVSAPNVLNRKDRNLPVEDKTVEKSISDTDIEAKLKMKDLYDSMKPIEKRKDGTLIDYGLKVSSRKRPEKLKSRKKTLRDSLTIAARMKEAKSNKVPERKKFYDVPVIKKQPTDAPIVKKQPDATPQSKSETKIPRHIKGKHDNTYKENPEIPHCTKKDGHKIDKKSTTDIPDIKVNNTIIEPKEQTREKDSTNIKKSDKKPQGPRSVERKNPEHIEQRATNQQFQEKNVEKAELRNDMKQSHSFNTKQNKQSGENLKPNKSEKFLKPSPEGTGTHRPSKKLVDKISKVSKTSGIVNEQTFLKNIGIVFGEDQPAEIVPQKDAKEISKENNSDHRIGFTFESLQKFRKDTPSKSADIHFRKREIIWQKGLNEDRIYSGNTIRGRTLTKDEDNSGSITSPRTPTASSVVKPTKSGMQTNTTRVDSIHSSSVLEKNVNIPNKMELSQKIKGDEVHSKSQQYLPVPVNSTNELPVQSNTDICDDKSVIISVGRKSHEQERPEKNMLYTVWLQRFQTDVNDDQRFS